MRVGWIPILESAVPPSNIDNFLVQIFEWILQHEKPTRFGLLPLKKASFENGNWRSNGIKLQL